MKKKTKITALCLLTLGSIGFAGLSHGEGFRGRRQREERRQKLYEQQRQFVFAVCVGQDLARQGLTLPIPQKGEPLSLDSPTQAGLESAVETCRQQMGDDPTASPSPSPVPGASPTPSPVPVSSGSAINSTEWRRDP